MLLFDLENISIKEKRPVFSYRYKYICTEEEKAISKDLKSVSKYQESTFKCLYDIAKYFKNHHA